jgi:hypothetical protein
MSNGRHKIATEEAPEGSGRFEGAAMFVGIFVFIAALILLLWAIPLPWATLVVLVIAYAIFSWLMG